MRIKELCLHEHPILGEVFLSFVNPKTHEPYSVVAFVGENGCGKTTILSELYNYANSPYVVNRERVPTIVGPKEVQTLFIRQDSLFTDALNEIYKKITGEELTKTISENPKGGQNVFGLRSNVPVNNTTEASIILDLLKDERIKELYVTGKYRELNSAGEASRVIDGKVPELDYTMISSGQAEILLKLKTLGELRAGTDLVLLDEPETSLHPRWQKIILDLMVAMMQGKEGEEGPQLFVATHSERVLEALLNRGDALIISMYKNPQGAICAKPVDLMGLVLPEPSFAELDSVIFKMPSFEYHNQLLSYYATLENIESTKTLDRRLRRTKEFKEGLICKEWEKVGNNPYTYETLPLYIRNWCHHPKEGMKPTLEELEQSIRSLKKIIRRSLSKRNKNNQ